MDYILETFNLSKEFSRENVLSRLVPRFIKQPNQKILAVENVNLRLRRGELFCLLGPNGAGKTTLIKMLCCLILPSQGTARINGNNIITEERKVKLSIGLVSGNERSFYWRLTGRQNLNFFAALYGLTQKQAKAQIDHLVESLQIEMIDRRFQEWSAGMRQKLAIARSLLHDPEILFMDEPTRNLDPFSAQRIRRFIKEDFVFKQGKTVFLITQNLDEAEFLSHHLAIMVKGRIKAEGSPEELRKAITIHSPSLEGIFNHYVSS